MPARDIDKIVIHCSASRNGVSLASMSSDKGGPHSAAIVIDGWHALRGFKRGAAAMKDFNPQLRAIGYHFVIDTDGTLETARAISEIGAHVKNFNATSIGVCLVGTDCFTRNQWDALSGVIDMLHSRYMKARIVGHRDLSPDRNQDGKITPDEFTKICPGFDVADWLKNDHEPPKGHTVFQP